MVLEIEENGELSQKQQNSIIEAQEPFKERVFCIVGDEMKAKMEALGLSEEDISEMTVDYNFSESLSKVDIYFTSLKSTIDHCKEVILYSDLSKNMTQMMLGLSDDKIPHFLELIKNFSEFELKIIQTHYFDMMYLGKLAGNNVYEFFRGGSWRIKILQTPQKNEIIQGFTLLGSEFVHVYEDDSGFLTHMLSLYPGQFSMVCQKLRALMEASNTKDFLQLVYLPGIADFLTHHPRGGDFLVYIAKLFQSQSPAILSNSANFIGTIYVEHFEKRYEIIHRIHEIVSSFDSVVQELFLKNGLRFFSLIYKKEDVEKICSMMEQMQHSSNAYLNDQTRHIFYSYGTFGERAGLHILYELYSYFPEDFNYALNKIMASISKHSHKGGLHIQGSWEKYFTGIQSLLSSGMYAKNKELFYEILSYYEKIGSKKSDIEFIYNMKDYFFDVSVFGGNYFDETQKGILENITHSKIAIAFAFSYLIQYKKSKVIPFIKDLHLLQDIGLEVDLQTVLFGGMSLEYYNPGYLNYLFQAENVEQTRIWKHFKKISSTQKFDNDMKKRIGSLLVTNEKHIFHQKQLPTIRKIQNIFAQEILNYFHHYVKRKIHIKFKSEFGLKQDFRDQLLDENLIELYKMYRGTYTNKGFAKTLICEYLKGNVYVGKGDVSQQYPYNRMENQQFLDEVFGSKQNIWLSKRERLYQVSDQEVQNPGELMDDNIRHHMKVAMKKMRLLKINTHFSSPQELIMYFDTQVRKQKPIYEKNIFSDLELQILSIKNILKAHQGKKLKQVKIYHELNPLKIAMMGNWVDGSCLSYYNSVGNYRSAITNALEVNKGVFYFEDENGTIIARILVGVDGDGNIEVHPAYMKGHLVTNIKPYFVDYIQSLAQDLGKTLSGDRKKVKLLFCDNWYAGD